MLVFAAAALAVIPCAAVMGEATEAIAARTGPGIGGLLNVTFGNAPELIIAFFALLEGLQEVVKASIVGSIIGNILLVMGAAMLVGGLPRDKQTFNRTAANAQSAMLLLALAALMFPAIFQLVHGGGLPAVGEERVNFGSDLEKLSFGVAIVLLVSYVAGLIFSLRTHRDVFNPFREGDGGGGDAPLVGAPGGHLPRARRGGGGRDERDPGRVDQRGLGGHRAVASSSSACSWWRSWATRRSTGSRCWWRPRTRWTWR